MVDVGNLKLSVSDVLQVLLSLDNNFSISPDNIPPILLKSCAYTIATPLCSIFNLSLSTGVFLDEWKYSVITPLHKSGTKSLVENYRPIAKLQLIPKVFEAVVNSKLYILIHNNISVHQHGFLRGRSTTTNLSIFSHFCLSQMDMRSQVDTIYTDFSKAFDRVQHSVLLSKLEMYGFHSKLLLWIKSYLINRKQVVKIDNVFSKEIINFSGVPQGSHLGPLLFIIFINDLPLHLSFSKCLLFADDLKVFSSINSLNDANNVQSDLNNLVIWCNNNGLYFNIKKCSVVTFSRNHNPLYYNYRLEDNILQRLDSHKDLGVIFDSKMNFSNHTDHVISKANSMLGFVIRNSKDFDDPYTLKTLYSSIVRPHLEYCTVIWSPFTVSAINRIEKVQKRFTKFALRKVFGYSNVPSYETRCILIDLKPLALRRKLNSILFAFDVLNCNIDCSVLLSMFSIYAPSRSLRPRNCEFLNVPYHSTSYAKHNPITRACANFNEYYYAIDFNVSRNALKIKLLNLLQSN